MPVDPDALREALDAWGPFLTGERMEYRTILAAAREFLRLMETAETVEWCVTHKAEESGDGMCWKRDLMNYHGFCRMVEAVLTRRDTEPVTELDRNQMGIW